MSDPFFEIISRHKKGHPIGIYSVCSANRYVIEACLVHARADDTSLLIESTCNQVNQHGGYTGMTPAQFASFIRDCAREEGFPMEKIILGGDHLGPNPWQEEKSETALAKAAELVRSYVLAGYRKIHLDTSMRCADDKGESHTPLDPRIIADRAADLCRCAEEAADSMGAGYQRPYYVIGTDVPIPGGAQEESPGVVITTVEDVENTIEITKRAFRKHKLDSAWKRVVAVVVQPGVEYGDDFILDYSGEKAGRLSEYINKYENLVYEAHSTDYQTRDSLSQMVRDHFAILKVGPCLTFAFREAVFALAAIEEEWLNRIYNIKRSHIRPVLDKVMRDNPKHWQSHYRGDENQQYIARQFSYSDRCRYYWNDPAIQEALNRLLNNLSTRAIPPTLLSQYMPLQYRAVREGRISGSPSDLINDKIRTILSDYSHACGIERTGTTN